MKNINIKYKIAAVILALGSTYSCSKDELELLPISAISDTQFYKTEDDIFAATIAIYDGLQNIPLNEHALLEMRSDNGKTQLGEGEWGQLETFNVQPTNSVVAGYWSANYNVIFRANKVLANIDVVTTPTKKANYSGEAKFARALAHFNLVRAFGEVPVIDKVVGIDDAASFGKNSVNQAYTLIEQDLIDAIATLPTKASTSFGRATKQAAQGILAKVYLTRQNYTAALPILTTLVGDTSYSLQAVYKNVFYTEGNSEILFAIPYTLNSSTESQTYSYEMTIGQASGLTWPTANFSTFMSDALDLRKDVNINPLITTQNGKYLAGVGQRLGGNDWIVLRLADVYLMYTEAVMGTATSTSDATAIDYFYKVRNRAFAIDIDPLTVTSVTKTELLNQRRAELAFENHRLYDLIRFGEAQTVLSAYKPTHFNGPKDLLLPIPQTEINVSKGALVQNPLYNN